jgi:hypothetical protein
VRDSAVDVGAGNHHRDTKRTGGHAARVDRGCIALLRIEEIGEMSVANRVKADGNLPFCNRGLTAGGRSLSRKRQVAIRPNWRFVRG